MKKNSDRFVGDMTGRLLGLSLFACVMAINACDVSAVPTVAGDDNVDKKIEGIGAASCAWTVPDATYVNAIPAPPSVNLSSSSGSFFSAYGYNSPTTYSNPGCYKAAIVQVTQWLDAYGDFVIAPANPIAPVGAITQAACEGLDMAAYVYPRTSLLGETMFLEAQGKWIPAQTLPGGSPQLPPVTIPAHCIEPSLTFGGDSWPDTESSAAVANGTLFQTSLGVGETYRVAATYRNADNSTRAINITTRGSRCGEPGQACCAQSQHVQCFDPSVTTCYLIDTGVGVHRAKCFACGEEGELSCDPYPSNEHRRCFSETLTPAQNSACVRCGSETQPCCLNGEYNNTNTATCLDHLKCNFTNYLCEKAPPQGPTLPPPPPPNTGVHTCSGAAANFAAANHPVRFQYNATSCGNITTEFANSDTEAQQCLLTEMARVGTPITVLTGSETLQSYPFCVCSFGGPGSITVPAYSADAAAACIGTTMMGADSIAAGACTANSCPQ